MWDRFLMTETSEAPPQSESVCLGCGLCCDGSLLTHLAVADASDLGLPLQALGVEIIAAADPAVFELPCPAVSAGRCTIHHLHRPRACAQFECALSASVLEGSVTADDARRIIDDTLRLRDAVAEGTVSVEDLDARYEHHVGRRSFR